MARLDSVLRPSWFDHGSLRYNRGPLRPPCDYGQCWSGACRNHSGRGCTSGRATPLYKSKKPEYLIAGAMVAQSDYNYSVIGLSSLDGGLTWYKHEFSAKGAGDVWTAFLADGTAVLSFLAQPDSALQVFRSGDGGRTWSERPATTARGQDHPTLLFGPDGSLYTVSAGYARTKSERARDAIIVTRSADGGASFAGPVSVIASNLLYEAGNPAIAPDGMLLIPFADHHRPGSRRRLQGPRDWMVVSSDGGKTFSEPLLISESCDGRGGWSSLAVFRDRTYHVCPAA